MLLNVRGLDMYEEEDREGDGDGGELGGNGLIDASSSASAATDGDQRDSASSSSSDNEECLETYPSSPLSEMALRCALLLLELGPGDGKGDVASLLLGFKGIAPDFPFDICLASSVRLALEFPPSLRCSQLMIGLLDLL